MKCQCGYLEDEHYAVYAVHKSKVTRESLPVELLVDEGQPMVLCPEEWELIQGTLCAYTEEEDEV